MKKFNLYDWYNNHLRFYYKTYGFVFFLFCFLTQFINEKRYEEVYLLFLKLDIFICIFSGLYFGRVLSYNFLKNESVYFFSKNIFFYFIFFFLISYFISLFLLHYYFFRYSLFFDIR
jgi:hypothetical protein